MKIIATIGVTVQVGPADWIRENRHYNIKEDESVAQLFSRTREENKKFTCCDSCITISELIQSDIKKVEGGE